MDELIQILNKVCDRLGIDYQYNAGPSTSVINGFASFTFVVKPYGKQEFRFIMTERDLMGMIYKAHSDGSTLMIDPDIEINKYNSAEILYLNFRLFVKKPKAKRSSFTDNYKTYDDSTGRGDERDWFRTFYQQQQERQRQPPPNDEERSQFGDFTFEDMFGPGGPFGPGGSFDPFNEWNSKQKQQQKQGPRPNQHSTGGRESQYHITLGVKYGATQEEIKKVYRRKAMEWHPDRNGHREKEAKEMFQKINEAYSILKT